MTSRSENLRIEHVEYYTVEGRCTATNVMYTVDGSHRSSRFPYWIDINEARRRVEKTLSRELPGS